MSLTKIFFSQLLLPLYARRTHDFSSPCFGLIWLKKSLIMFVIIHSILMDAFNGSLYLIINTTNFIRSLAELKDLKPSCLWITPVSNCLKQSVDHVPFPHISISSHFIKRKVDEEPLVIVLPWFSFWFFPSLTVWPWMSHLISLIINYEFGGVIMPINTSGLVVCANCCDT